jgi:hypothetical protein
VSSACLISHVPSYPFLPADSVAGRFWNWRTLPALYSARGVEHPAEQVLDQVALFAVVLRSGSSANGSVISLPLLGGRCPRVARTSGEREPSHCQTEKCSHPGRVEAARSPLRFRFVPELNRKPRLPLALLVERTERDRLLAATIQSVSFGTYRRIAVRCLLAASLHRTGSRKDHL